jgi:predicted ATP-dependent serine protease
MLSSHFLCWIYFLQGTKSKGERMKSVQSPLVKVSTKAPTGIAGFDEITAGGLPCGLTTLMGGPGSGKTILALQFLVHGARRIEFDALLVKLAPSPPSVIVSTFIQTQIVLQALGLDVIAP